MLPNFACSWNLQILFLVQTVEIYQILHCIVLFSEFLFKSRDDAKCKKQKHTCGACTGDQKWCLVICTSITKISALLGTSHTGQTELNVEVIYIYSV